MGIRSECAEAREQEAKNEKLAGIGRDIRALPERKQQELMDVLESFGVNVYEAMHQSATHHWDPYW